MMLWGATCSPDPHLLGGPDMSDKQRKPSLAEGSVSRNEDGAFRGAEGHIGLNHTDGAPTYRR